MLPNFFTDELCYLLLPAITDLFIRESVLWESYQLLCQGHILTLLWAGAVLHFQKALHLCSPSQLFCRVSKPYVQNQKHYSLSLHGREGFVRHCSVIVGEREVFVILTIPVCLSETDLKIMRDCFGGEIQHTIREVFSSTTSKILIFCYIWLYKFYLFYFALK